MTGPDKKRLNQCEIRQGRTKSVQKWLNRINQIKSNQSNQIESIKTNQSILNEGFRHVKEHWHNNSWQIIFCKENLRNDSWPKVFGKEHLHNYFLPKVFGKEHLHNNSGPIIFGKENLHYHFRPMVFGKEQLYNHSWPIKIKSNQIESNRNGSHHKLYCTVPNRIETINKTMYQPVFHDKSNTM